MPERLPPLKSLKAVEAAARHASFRKAANELNVSPAAISHQIKNLEAYLGVQLFHRERRTIRLSATAALIDDGPTPAGASGGFREAEADLAIRFGEGDWPGCRVDKLMDVAALPLCSPRLLEGRRALRRPDDLRHHTLLHDDTGYAGRPEWRAWLAAAGVAGIDAARGPRFNQAA